MTRSLSLSTAMATSDRPQRATARTRSPAATIQTILNTALMAENVAATLYYTALTTPAVMHDRRLGGSSADPNNPGLPPDGTPGNVRDLQAALDAEVKHAAALVAAGAGSPHRAFYFAAATFRGAGMGAPGGFLDQMHAYEGILLGTYLAAIEEFLRVDRPDLAGVAAEIMGVEAEHYALCRCIVATNPANDLVLAAVPFTSIDEATRALQPYVTGRGLPGGATRAIPIPSRAATTRVIGKYSTRIVTRFL